MEEQLTPLLITILQNIQLSKVDDTILDNYYNLFDKKNI